MEDVSLEWVVNNGYFKEFNPIPVHFSVEFMSTLPRSVVGLQFLIITKIKPNNRNATPTTTFVGWMAEVRVDNLTRGSSNTQFNLVFGKLDQLFFDLARWYVVARGYNFFASSAKEGRKWITKQVTFGKPIMHK
jgi:hypothetical protein